VRDQVPGSNSVLLISYLKPDWFLLTKAFQGWLRPSKEETEV